MPDNTEGKQALTLFKPGQSGNPKGRPKGSRNKLQEKFIDDFLEAWQAFGRPALLAAAWKDPAKFVQVAASLLPKEVKLDGEVQHRFAEVPKTDTREQWLQRTQSGEPKTAPKLN